MQEFNSDNHKLYYEISKACANLACNAAEIERKPKASRTQEEKALLAQYRKLKEQEAKLYLALEAEIKQAGKARYGWEYERDAKRIGEIRYRNSDLS